MNIVFLEFTSVSRSIGPQELASPVLLSIAVRTLIACIVRPDFFAFSMLLVFKPVAFVSGAIGMVVLAEAVSFVILPLAVVDVAIGVNQSALSVGLVSPPRTFIQRAIDPDLNASSIFATKFVPLTLVLSAILKSHEGSLDASDTVG